MVIIVSRVLICRCFWMRHCGEWSIRCSRIELTFWSSSTPITILDLNYLKRKKCLYWGSLEQHKSTFNMSHKNYLSLVYHWHKRNSHSLMSWKKQLIKSSILCKRLRINLLWMVVSSRDLLLKVVKERNQDSSLVKSLYH